MKRRTKRGIVQLVSHGKLLYAVGGDGSAWLWNGHWQRVVELPEMEVTDNGVSQTQLPEREQVRRRPCMQDLRDCGRGYAWFAGPCPDTGEYCRCIDDCERVGYCLRLA